jgi:hypothetical protein
MPFRSMSFVLVALALATSTGGAHACACCANPGQFSDITASKPDDYDSQLLDHIVFGPTATLFTGEADTSDVSGLKATADAFDLEVTKTAGMWTMSFSDAGKPAGTLSFRIDGRLQKRAMDPRAATPKPGAMITLNKDWTLTSPVAVTGMFDKRATNVALILHGRGNSCTSVEDFTHWTAVVGGNGFSFHFYGDLSATKP